MVGRLTAVLGRLFVTGPRRWLHRVLAAVVAVTVALVAVLAVALAGGPPAHGPSAARARTATLGLIAPLSADRTPVGAAVRNAVRLAVDEANAQGTIPGWKVRLSVQDDLSRPDGGARAAGTLAADQSLIGVVGPLSSTVAMVALPTLDAAGIAVVSPSNSQPELTGITSSALLASPAARGRPYRTYFRLSGTDVLAARDAAEFAVRVIGRQRIAVVDGGPDFGTSLAQRFATEATRLGAAVTGTHRVDGSADDTTEVEQVARYLRIEAPDLVYVATGQAFAGKLREELAEHGPAVSILGSDGLFDPHYPEQARDTAEGDLVADLGAPLSALPAAGRFAAAYLDRWPAESDSDSAGGGDPRSGEPHGGESGRDAPATGAPAGGGSTGGSPAAAGPAGDGQADGDGHAVVSASPAVSPAPDVDVIPSVAAYAYDAAQALLRAAAGVLPGRDTVDEAARAAIVTAVGQGRFPGVTGDVGFDAWGDPLTSVVTVYEIRRQRFVPVWVHRSE
ncbi:branched-chain amino acid ABC transporter substrate-binding protein [Protofrankia coriariae]|uniref:branched-chain amino acid ABC transporter substrate-binding protein n=1 Tax=Protofrankia coriariae TaxID=1562887 RepID=UPI00069C9DD2|nr:branched-chain amino acid ABC transporter substrate-binding protein [Protofrankia coriariae]